LRDSVEETHWAHNPDCESSIRGIVGPLPQLKKLTMQEEYSLDQHIFNETGFSLKNGDYGFIAGTHSPYQGQGFVSATNRPGFMVWKKGNIELAGELPRLCIEINEKTHSEAVKKVIEFLKN
jgi:hypothetical protein